MVIVTQSGNRIVKDYIFLNPCRELNEFFVKVYTGLPIGVAIGKYASYERCQEVVQQIVNAYKEGLPVFEMPKE